MKHRSVDLTATNAMQLVDQKSHSPDQLSGTEINAGEHVASYGQWGGGGRGVEEGEWVCEQV